VRQAWLRGPEMIREAGLVEGSGNDP